MWRNKPWKQAVPAQQLLSKWSLMIRKTFMPESDSIYKNTMLGYEAKRNKTLLSFHFFRFFP